jgi:hypothetical protein
MTEMNVALATFEPSWLIEATLQVAPKRNANVICTNVICADVASRKCHSTSLLCRSINKKEETFNEIVSRVQFRLSTWENFLPLK